MFNSSGLVATQNRFFRKTDRKDKISNTLALSFMAN